MNPFTQKKVLIFGLLGALGCLAGWLVGEGFLAVALPSAKSGEPPTASLATRPQPPVIVVPQPPTSSPDFAQHRKNRGGAVGKKITLTLRWFNHNDLDLHCVTPNGEAIFWYPLRIAEAAGEREKYPLDVDSNAFDDKLTNPAIENIKWDDPPLGKYRVFVQYFTSRDPDPTEYVYEVLTEDRAEIKKGSISRSTPIDPVLVNRYAPFYKKYHEELKAKKNEIFNRPIQEIVEFDVPGLLVAASAEVVLFPDQNNKLQIQLRRDARNAEPVTIKFRGETAELELPDEVVIAGNRSDAEVDIAARGSAALGTRALRIIAEGKYGTVETQSNAVIRAAPVLESSRVWSWSMVLVIGFWTGLLAMGMSIALIVGQNRYMGKPWLTSKQASIALAGGGLAGFVAGGIGQTLLTMLARADVLPQIGFLFGWLLLGGLLGRGVGFFIPNLQVWRACAAGVIGGLLGALGFILISRLGDIAGRLVGAGLLGFCIGLMVALVEVAFRKAWLEVRYGPRETIAVNLGPEPIRVGGDAKACTVFARGAAPLALRFWVRAGKVVCDDAVAGRTEELVNGASRRVGNLEVVVRTGAGDNGAGASPIRLNTPKPASIAMPAATQVNPSEVKVKPPSPPPAPWTKQSPPPPKVGSTPTTKGAPAGGDACPLCGRKVAGSSGQRYCLMCDHTF
jgi:hypothetical protein